MIDKSDIESLAIEALIRHAAQSTDPKEMEVYLVEALKLVRRWREKTTSTDDR
jgi:hypothetical protein